MHPPESNKKITITYQEFLTKYSDHSRLIKVSFAPDGKSNWQSVTSYGFGMDCRWIV